MEITNTNQVDRPIKRMRLGTKSCAECRKRKIRCNFSPDSRVCDYCISHETTCVPQQPKSDPTTTTSQADKKLKKEISELQGVVNRICKAINLDISSSSNADFETSTIETLKRLAHVPTPASSTEDISVTQSYESQAGGEDEEKGYFDDGFNSFEHAPLLNLFREALFIEDDGSRKSSVSSQSRSRGSDQKMESYIKLMRAIVPIEADLDLILIMTENYWFLWKAFDLFTPLEQIETTEQRVAQAKTFISFAMSSNSPVLVAKAVLNLALCIQQLPRTFDYQRTSLPGTPAALIDSYADATEILLLSESAKTLDGIECCLMQYKFYINMGKPRKAWLCNQRAIGWGILLGLHQLENRIGAREKSVWGMMWQIDRILSLSLGVPYTIQNSWVDPSMRGVAYHENVMYDLCTIAGMVIERDQTRPRPDYFITQTIELECQRCMREAPSEWWDMVMGPETPLYALYGISATKAFFSIVRKLLHLPYMLKSLTDSTYEGSRIAAMDCSRKIIRCYQDIRNYSGESVLICDLMDFQTFSAALTATIYLLSPGGQTGSQQEKVDWMLIQGATTNLRRVSEALDCRVASQASTLLEHLYGLRFGLYMSDEIYETTIPYFGKVQIGGIKNELQVFDSGVQMEQGSSDLSFFNNVEFRTNVFDYNYMGGFLNEAELGVDWTVPFEFEAGFDWNQTFEAPTVWGQ